MIRVEEEERPRCSHLESLDAKSYRGSRGLLVTERTARMGGGWRDHPPIPTGQVPHAGHLLVRTLVEAHQMMSFES